MRRHLALIVGMLLAPLAPMSATADTHRDTYRYVLSADGERIGHLVATVRGDAHDVDWHVDNNGRGEKLKERLRVNADGVPLYAPLFANVNACSRILTTSVPELRHCVSVRFGENRGR